MLFYSPFAIRHSPFINTLLAIVTIGSARSQKHSEFVNLKN